MSTELAGVLIAAVSVVLGWVVGTRTERATKKQYQLDAMAFTSSWYTDLRAWASEVVDVLSETAEWCDNNHKSKNQRDEALLVCRYRLSALIDRGRFFFPNEYHEEYGLHKPEAYRGFRHPTLDYLVGAYQIINDPALVEEFGFSDKKSALIKLKRGFVSGVQDALKPRSQIREIDRLVEASRSKTTEKDSSVAKFLSSRIRPKSQ